MWKKSDVRVNINSMFGQLSSYNPSSHKISKVPNFLRGVNQESYNPTIVAIGPIHRDKNHVKAMEKHKVWYLQQLLRRRGEQSIERYLVELRKCEELARQFYSSCIELPTGKDAFVEMLLLDGIFVIELARKWSSRNLINDNDFIFQYSEVHYNEVLIQIRRDLMMIENQLPFFIISELFNMTKIEGRTSNNVMSLHGLLLNFICRIIPGQPEFDSEIDAYDVDDHFFGLVYKAYFSITIDPKQNHRDFMFQEINSTSELQESGIKFLKAENKTMFMNVSFTGKVMEIPKLDVADVTESLFRNLIAYEQTRGDDKPRYVTEYCFLMQFLVNSTKDVEILRRAGILINWIGDDETVRLFFNKLTKNVATSQDFYYSNIIRNMNEYCHHHKWRSNLRRNYFNSPWSILSVLGAIILLLLTAVQTILAVLSYIKEVQIKNKILQP